MRLPCPRSLAGQLFAMQAVLVAVVVAGCALFTYVSDRGQAETAARRRATAAATAVADAGSVREAIMESADPTVSLQPYATDVQRHAGVDFVTIMDTGPGIRWTHPDRHQIGERFLRHIGPRAEGGDVLGDVHDARGLGAGGHSGVRRWWPGRGPGQRRDHHRRDHGAGAGAGARGGRCRAGRAGARRHRYVCDQRGLRRHTHGMNAHRAEPDARPSPGERCTRSVRGW